MAPQGRRVRRPPGLSGILFSGWNFGDIQEDPRWLPFLRSLGNAPEQVAAIKFKKRGNGIAPADADLLILYAQNLIQWIQA